MTWCYLPDCHRAAKHRLQRVTQPRWRRWLHLPPKAWHVCDEHLFDPIARRRPWTRHG